MMYLDENGNERITPAGAGKTRDNQHPPPARQDHPRRCGENFATCVASCFFAGSPPQVRGKLQAIVDALPQIRITPAGAGKTRLQQRAQCQRRDHPRRCGENSAWGCIEYAHPGSPPQVRGKLPSSIASSILYRITPAGAGKTILEQNPLQELIGSPPQVRGKQSWYSVNSFSLGITPAGAGKTRCWKPNLTATQDHPRRCGENATALYSCLWLTGSPPQVRGKLAVHLQCRLSVRITPAGAGKTCGDWSMI